ncbi:glycosyltransferase [Pseudoalteromonas sp. S3173]|uniref:glycosyltransferase n=1 Tax=Pseudoalteromonas sp. S3173 TaxID=579531 RepID=UPI00110CAC90|nr:glycosyltransferase [Pseudoalteromonas sp. S3173]TMS60470.1 hypothetical protein CWC10_16625 [Pseudoalteromonas sp. S3173]
MILAKISYYICSYFTSSNKQDGWVIVAVETASMLKNISSALPNSISVNFAPNRFYDFNYDYEVYPQKGLLKLINLIYSPILFGYLLSKYDKFMYLGAIGFVSPYTDGRHQEFKFLKSRNKQLVCYFLGSEIRSFNLLNKFSQDHSLDVLTTYQSISHAGIDASENEYKRKQLGETADRYANVIFNPSTDQMAYIKRKTSPCIYFLADDLFLPSLHKFDDLSEIIVLHGPSSPIIKGTPLVRAAVKKLKVEGYRFKYVELINVPHEKMLKELQNAHIVLNEFYAFVPGVFGLEAMANHCALLTSADENIETTLPCGANKAWCVTPYWNIYDNLKNLLDNPEQIKSQANAGFKWAKANYQYDQAVNKLNEIVND